MRRFDVAILQDKGVIMALEAHIQSLEQKHQALESQLADLTLSPASTDHEMRQLKQEKLKLKDEITRLKAG